jgi:hypothetical protein
MSSPVCNSGVTCSPKLKTNGATVEAIAPRGAVAALTVTSGSICGVAPTLGVGEGTGAAIEGGGLGLGPGRGEGNNTGSFASPGNV